MKLITRAALSKPKPNNVKFFSSIELFTLLADRDWLDDAMKTIGQYWKRKNAKRRGLTLENLADVALVHFPAAEIARSGIRLKEKVKELT